LRFATTVRKWAPQRQRDYPPVKQRLFSQPTLQQSLARAALVMLVAPASGHYRRFAGKHIFPAPLTFDDPFAT